MALNEEAQHHKHENDRLDDILDQIRAAINTVSRKLGNERSVLTKIHELLEREGYK